MIGKDQNLGEEALSKAAEAAMTTQLDQVEHLDVDIHTDPGKLMQGELEAVDIEGKGLVMNQDLRTEELTIHTSSIAIDPLKAAFGDIQLKQPTDASTHIVLTEADMERAFNSEFIQDKFKELKVNVDGQPTDIQPKEVHFGLPGDGKIALSSKVDLAETGETKQVAFTAVPKMEAGGHRVTLEDVQHEDGEVSPELTNALIESAQELLDLRNFELEGMSLRFRQLDVQSGKMTIDAEAHIDKFPPG